MDQVTIRKWGNSNGICLPKNVLEQLELNVSDTLELEVQGNTIILHKRFQHKTFEERLAAYQGKMKAYDFDWGEPKGRELL